MTTIPKSTPSRVRVPVKPKKAIPNAKPNLEPIGVTVDNAAKMISLSKTSFLNLVKENKVRTVRIGHRVIVSVQSLRDLIDDTKNEPCNSSEKQH